MTIRQLDTSASSAEAFETFALAERALAERGYIPNLTKSWLRMNWYRPEGDVGIRHAVIKDELGTFYVFIALHPNPPALSLCATNL